jgi:pre-mRNA-splicing factor SYF1
MCAAHPEDVSRSLKVDPIIRSGIARFSDEVGKLWTRLVDYYIRLGQFEKARDIYEEAIHSVITVRDFTVVFDSYVKFEETVLTAKMGEAEESDSDSDDDDGEEKDRAIQHKKNLEEEVELRMARLEYLMDKRPILLNSVVLRQNPHNVYEWHKRVKLYKGDDTRTLMTFMEAVKTVDPKLAHGRLSSLWLSMSWFYESHDDLENARVVMKKATEVEYRTVEV